MLLRATCRDAPAAPASNATCFDARDLPLCVPHAQLFFGAVASSGVLSPAETGTLSSSTIGARRAFLRDNRDRATWHSTRQAAATVPRGRDCVRGLKRSRPHCDCSPGLRIDVYTHVDRCHVTGTGTGRAPVLCEHRVARDPENRVYVYIHASICIHIHILVYTYTCICT
jgi:hypothetical protein